MEENPMRRMGRWGSRAPEVGSSGSSSRTRSSLGVHRIPSCTGVAGGPTRAPSTQARAPSTASASPANPPRGRPISAGARQSPQARAPSTAGASPANPPRGRPISAGARQSPTAHVSHGIQTSIPVAPLEKGGHQDAERARAHATSALNARDRMDLERLRGNHKRLKADHARVCRTLMIETEKNREPYRFYKIQEVKRVVMPYLLMGKFEDCTLYPKPEDLKQAFKIGFKVNEDKEDEALAFEDAYGEGGAMLKHVSGNMRSRRTQYLRNARIELWRLLNCEEKRPMAPSREKQDRLHRLQSLQEDDKWRVKVDAMGQVDPFGSDAIHGALCHSLFGAAYLPETSVELTLEQAGFFFHGLERAMHDERLDLHKMDFHRDEMRKAETRIREFIPNMKKIKIVEKMSLEDDARTFDY